MFCYACQLKNSNKKLRKNYLMTPTVSVPAVRAAVETELSYRNDTIIVFFFAAKKDEDNTKVSLASSN